MNYKISLVLLLIAFLLKFVSIFLTNFNLFGDEAQYWAWSKNLDFGYYSKPPLLAWLISGHTFFFGNSFEAIKIFPLFFYFFTSYVVYLITYELYKKRDLAIIASISFYLVPAVSVSSFLLSTDVILLFFWSLSLLFLLKIRKNQHLINFLLLGIFLGLSFLAKYAAVYFLLSLILFLFLDKETWGVFSKNIFKSVVFVVSAFLVFLPNIIWNLNNGWITLLHTSDNAGLERLGFNLFQGFEFLLTQVFMLGPVLFVFLIILIKNIKIDSNNKFLLSFSLPVFIIVFFESILVRANANWAAVALIPFYIFAFKCVYSHTNRIVLLNNFVNFVFCSIFFILIAFSFPLKVFDRINGVSVFSNFLNDNFLKDQKYLVVEDRLILSSLKYELRNTDIKIMTPHNPSEKINNNFDLSNPLAGNFDNNFILIGSPSVVGYLINKNKINKLNKVSVGFSNSPIEIYEVIF